MRIVLTHKPPFPGQHPAPSADPLRWLVGLRWITVFAYAGLVAAMHWWFMLPLATPWLFALTALTALSNALLSVPRLVARAPSLEALVGGVLSFDTLTLTLLLALGGGPFNPFSVFYLVHVALAAVLLEGGWALGMAIFTSLAFGLLFFITPERSMHVLHHGPGFLVHLRGMWLAYVLAAAATGTFVARQARALRERERELSQLRDLAARTEKLTALHTLAAGAAHELGTPLGTIALVASELSETKHPVAEELRQDFALIVQETQRCRTILQRMATEAASPHGEAAAPVTLGALAETVRAAFPGAALRVEVPERDATAFSVPQTPLTQVLVSLVQNALQASPPGEAVELQLSLSANAFEARITDRGDGIPEALLKRLGEPFFTTKDPGEGMGLGLFLARQTTESLGGELDVESHERRGTVATLRLPRGASA